MISTQSAPYQDMCISRDLVCALDFITYLLITDIKTHSKRETCYQAVHTVSNSPASQSQTSQNPARNPKNHNRTGHQTSHNPAGH